MADPKHVRIRFGEQGRSLAVAGSWISGVGALSGSWASRPPLGAAAAPASPVAQLPADPKIKVPSPTRPGLPRAREKGSMDSPTLREGQIEIWKRHNPGQVMGAIIKRAKSQEEVDLWRHLAAKHDIDA
jgi:hypothetical protein